MPPWSPLRTCCRRFIFAAMSSVLLVGCRWRVGTSKRNFFFGASAGATLDLRFGLVVAAVVHRGRGRRGLLRGRAAPLEATSAGSCPVFPPFQELEVINHHDVFGALLSRLLVVPLLQL